MPVNVKEIIQTTIIDSSTPESISHEEVGNILLQVVELTNVPNGTLVVIYKGKQGTNPNQGNAMQVNDHVRGQLPGGTYWDRAIYNGGDPLVAGSYTVVPTIGIQGPQGPASTVPGPQGPQGPAGPATAVAKTFGEYEGGLLSSRSVIVADLCKLIILANNGHSYFELPIPVVGKEIIAVNDNIYVATIFAPTDGNIRCNYVSRMNGVQWQQNQIDVLSGKKIRFSCVTVGSWDAEVFYSPIDRVNVNVTPGPDNPNWAVPTVGNVGSCIAICNPASDLNSFIKLPTNPDMYGWVNTDSMIIYNISETVNLNVINSYIYHQFLAGVAMPSTLLTPYIIPPRTGIRFTFGVSSTYWIAEKINY